jgi:predicted RNase H-like HicB family nuclease
LGGAAYVPDLPGCITTGQTLEETKRNIREAIELHLEAMTQVRTLAGDQSHGRLLPGRFREAEGAHLVTSDQALAGSARRRQVAVTLIHPHR